MSKIKLAIGLMSGTSMDGIDVAALKTDGCCQAKPAGFQSFPYTTEFQRQLQAAVVDARDITDRTARPGCLAEVERELTRLHAEAVNIFLDTMSCTDEVIDVVGFHGQTLLHRPDAHLTVQIGDGQALADAIGRPVICDMRAGDVAAGGQGAPMAPIYHQALASGMSKLPIAVVNIGGVANVTWIGEDGALISFDTGPGNALIDDWVRVHTGQSYDVDGALAAGGEIDRKIVDAFLEQDYFHQEPPKSLDRNAWQIAGLNSASPEHGAATLTACTVETIARAALHFPNEPACWVVCGGGRHNKTIMKMLATAVEGQVMTAEDAGWNGDSIEAEAWAYMAVRSLEGLPLTFPGTTGVPQPQTGGVLCHPANA